MFTIVSVLAFIMLAGGVRGELCSCNSLPNHYYLPGQYGHEEASDACMAYGLSVGTVGQPNHRKVADCIKQCQHGDESRTWVAEVDGLAGDPCLYISRVSDGKTRVGAVLGVGSAMCSELTGGVLCARHHVDSKLLFDQKFYNDDHSNDKNIHDDDNLCSVEHLHVITTPIKHQTAEQLCNRHGYKLADYTTGTAKAITKALKQCSPQQPIGWLRSINGVINRRECIIGQVVDNILFDTLAVSVSLTPDWCDGDFVAVCQQ